MRRHFKGCTLEGPLPAALITCEDEKGANVFTAAWTGIICTHPPMAYVSVRPERFSYEKIRKTGVFAINLPQSKMTEQVDLCGMKSGRDFDKLSMFQTERAEKIECPVIADCPVVLECRVKKAEELGSHTMFIADIVSVSVDSALVDSKGKINIEQAGLLAFAHGNYFSLGRKTGSFGCSVQKKPRKKKGRQ